MTKTDAPHIEVRSLDELRAWLRDNHETSPSVWLVTYKKPHEAYINWGDVVAELLCWGWVDSAVRGIDDARYKHLVSPRKETSAWSAVNKALVARMRKEKRMQPAGEAKIATAKANGMWTFLDDVERLEVPGDLAEALGDARPNWDGWSKSIRRGWLEKIKWARTTPTREKRIAACADAARSNLKNGGLR